MDSVNNVLEMVENKIKNKLPSYNREKVLNSKLTYTAIVVISSSIFYMLGYLFLYGLYFSGGLTSNFFLVQALINPLPINFKSVVIVGAIFLLAFCFLLIPFIKMKSNLQIGYFKTFSIYLFFLFAFSCIICVFLVINFCSDLNDIGSMYLGIFATPLSLFMYILFISKNRINTVLGVLNSSFIGLIVYIPLNFYLNVNLSTDKLGYYYLLIFNIYTLLLFFSKKFNANYKSIPAIWFIWFLILIYISSILINEFGFKLINGEIWVALLYVFCFSTSFFIRFLILKVCKLIFEKFVKIESIQFFNLEQIKIIKNMTIYLILVFILFIGLAEVTYGVAMAGKSIQKLNSQNFDIIQYYTNNSSKPIEEVVGNVVAYKDNVYYISDESHKLITIKSNLVVSKPKE